MSTERGVIETAVVDQLIDVQRLFDAVADPSCGAECSFIGVARESSAARVDHRVVRLEYEAYVPMAEAELRAISAEAVDQWPGARVAVHHRRGQLGIGDAAVVIVVATPHRSDAFEACRYVIEELKRRVPIWKKEVFVDGAEWVDQRP